MNLNDLTIGDLQKISQLFTPSNSQKRDEGFCVVVLDRGFIMIGHLVIDGDWATIKNARGLRKWSSGKGLEWHIENGKYETTIDGNGTDRVCHISKLQNWAKTDESKW